MRMFGRVLQRAFRPGPISSRLPPPVSGHDAHAHSPQRPAIAHRSSIPASRGYDAFQKLLDAQTFSDLQSDPASKGSMLDTAKKSSPDESNELADCEDPFLCPQPIKNHHWRLQLRSSSQDVSMPDYPSNKTDNS